MSGGPTGTATDGRRALVLGASRGIGAAIAARLDADGLTVTAVGRTADDLLAVAAAGSRTDGLVLDVTSPAGRAALVEHAEAVPPHVVVSVVHARRAWATIARSEPESWLGAMDDHLTHLVELAAAVLPFQRSEGFGRWIVISSLTAAMGGRGQGTYVAHKAAVEGFARTLAVEEGRHGITANVVVPGFIATENLLGRYTDAQLAAFADCTVAERAGRPEEVAHAVSFLADPLAGYVTGAHVPVTGGAELGWWLSRAATTAEPAAVAPEERR